MKLMAELPIGHNSFGRWRDAAAMDYSRVAGGDEGVAGNVILEHERWRFPRSPGGELARQLAVSVGYNPG